MQFLLKQGQFFVLDYSLQLGGSQRSNNSGIYSHKTKTALTENRKGCFKRYRKTQFTAYVALLFPQIFQGYPVLSDPGSL